MACVQGSAALKCFCANVGYDLPPAAYKCFLSYRDGTKAMRKHQQTTHLTYMAHQRSDKHEIRIKLHRKYHTTRSDFGLFASLDESNISQTQPFIYCTCLTKNFFIHKLHKCTRRAFWYDRQINHVKKIMLDIRNIPARQRRPSRHPCHISDKFSSGQQCRSMSSLRTMTRVKHPRPCCFIVRSPAKHTNMFWHCSVRCTVRLLDIFLVTLMAHQHSSPTIHDSSRPPIAMPVKWPAPRVYIKVEPKLQLHDSPCHPKVQGRWCGRHGTAVVQHVTNQFRVKHISTD